MAEILNAFNSGLLEEVFKFTNWETLAESSKVCRSWNNICNKIVNRIKKSLDKKESILYNYFFTDQLLNYFVIGAKIENTILEKRQKLGKKKRKLNYNFRKLLGPLLGVGGFSKVFQLGMLQDACIKIAFGGKTVKGECNCKYVFEHQEKCLNDAINKNDINIVAEVLYRMTSGDTNELMCEEHVNFHLHSEFEYLRSLNGKTNHLLPVAYHMDYSGCNFFYVMERIHGVTLRTVLSKRKDDGPTIDMLPLFIDLMTQLDHLQEDIDFWHGDIKPENMMICKKEDGSPFIRLIDPVARRNSLDRGRIATLPYNPKGIYKQIADICGLLLVMFEVSTGLIIFKEMKYYMGKMSSTFTEIIEKNREILPESNKLGHWLLNRLSILEGDWKEVIDGISSVEGTLPVVFS